MTTLLPRRAEHAERTLNALGRSLTDESQCHPLWGILGGGLIGFGLCRRSLFGLAAIAAGGVLVYQSLIEQPSGSISAGAWLDRPIEPAGALPAAETPHVLQFGFPIYSGGDCPEPDDEVDEASMQSFPASDSPAYTICRI